MPTRQRGLYSGSYKRRRRRRIAWANSNPSLARCWRCKEPLATCGPNRNGRHRNGTPAHWTIGHPDHAPGREELECSPCNYQEGAQHGNTIRGRGSQISDARRKPRTPRPRPSL